MRDSFLELYRKARYKGRIVPQRQFSLLSLVFAMHTKQQAVSFVTRGEQSSDHPAADRVEAGQDLILVPPGEQLLFVKPSSCDSRGRGGQTSSWAGKFESLAHTATADMPFGSLW